MKNIVISAAIMLTGMTAANAQNSLASHLPATAAATVAGANVTVLKDQTLLVRYTQNGVSYKAFYDKNGIWLQSVASYGEALLPVSVRRLVQSGWHGWNIAYVDEVQTPGALPVYHIQVKHDNRLTILRVSDDEMETERELFSH
jgi:hypothetical protein